MKLLQENYLNKIENIFFTFILLLTLSSCNIINPAEPVPGYVQMDKFTIDHVDSLGSDSSKITDVWAYIDTKFQGAYPLPAQFPVIESGAHEMLFYPGIILNGISNIRQPYPFFEPDIRTVTLEPGKSITISPVTKYSPNVKCAWCEDFEGAGLSLVKNTGSDTTITKLSAGDPRNYQGNHSGAVYLDNTHSYMNLETDTGYVLPKQSNPVFLEMNYRCNNSFAVGLIVYSSSGSETVPVLIINAKETWNKIYIELAPTVSAYYNAYYFKIYFEALKEASVTNAEFYFDNFKLLHN